MHLAAWALSYRQMRCHQPSDMQTARQEMGTVGGRELYLFGCQTYKQQNDAQAGCRRHAYNFQQQRAATGLTSR